MSNLLGQIQEPRGLAHEDVLEDGIKLEDALDWLRHDYPRWDWSVEYENRRHDDSPWLKVVGHRHNLRIEIEYGENDSGLSGYWGCLNLRDKGGIYRWLWSTEPCGEDLETVMQTLNEQVSARLDPVRIEWWTSVAEILKEKP